LLFSYLLCHSLHHPSTYFLSVSSGHSNQKDRIAKPEETSDTAMIFQQLVACEKQNIKFCVPQFYRHKQSYILQDLKF
jgi:hypothetical protein